jgi:hypothetical protein
MPLLKSLAIFRLRSGDFTKQVKKSKRPVVRAVMGKSAAIVQRQKPILRFLVFLPGRCSTD